MRISLIVAMAENHVIGINKEMPWHLSADLRRFRDITMGKPILMGRRTHESIGRVLPGRINIVMTRDCAFQAKGCIVAHSYEEAVHAAGDADELMIIGGSALYQSFLPRAERLYLTLIRRPFEGDTVFPVLNWAEWDVSEQEDIEKDPQVDFSYSFLRLERRPPQTQRTGTEGGSVSPAPIPRCATRLS